MRRLLSCLRLLSGLIAGLALIGGTAQAQPYPTRPVRIVVSFPAGGPPDILARILASAVGETLGHNFIIENKAGASGIVGTSQVSRAEPDGYTIMVGSNTTHATNAAMYKQLPYDPVSGFTPIALLAETPLVLVAYPGFPAKSVAELVDAARKGDLTFASNSYGSTAHLSAELFQLRTGIKMTHLPYRGSAPMLVDLVAGRIPIAFDNLPPSMPFILGGQTRLLAVTSAQRSPLFPDAPTLSEAGIADYNASAWYGLFGPPGMPAPIVDTLHKAFTGALFKPGTKSRLEELGFAITPGAPDALAARVATDVKIWTSVVEQNHIERQ